MPNIKWRKKDFDTVTKAVRQFNATITRAAKKYNNAAILPPRISTEGFRNRITTRAEFNREINALKRFNIQTAKPVAYAGGLVTTEWQAKEARRLTNLVNRQRKKEAELLQISIDTKGYMGTPEQNNLKPKKLDLNKLTRRGWERFVMGVEKQSRDNYTIEKMNKYKENYLRSVLNNLGEYGKELYEYAKGLPADLMYLSFYDDPVVQIGYTSDPLPAEFIAETALEGWKRLMGE